MYRVDNYSANFAFLFYSFSDERGESQLLQDRPIDTTMFRRGLVAIPKPMPIQAPTPLPTPIPVPPPAPMPRPSVLPGTATIDQYYFPPPETPSIVAGQTTRLTRQGTAAVGQYLAPGPIQRSGAGLPALSSAAASAQADATRRALTAPLTPPPTAASSQIRLPGPRRFWRGTAAGRRVTMPSPGTIWQGVPTTSQIALPTPEDFWRK